MGGCFSWGCIKPTTWIGTGGCCCILFSSEGAPLPSLLRSRIRVSVPFPQVTIFFLGIVFNLPCLIILTYSGDQVK
ncbi:hypothetical protein BDW67DRAFT_118941 [Aspergillus spinulosporus]